MAGIGGRSKNQRGPHRKRNRYNPNKPDWNAVHKSAGVGGAVVGTIANMVGAVLGVKK
jgi:hypothetical protein